MIVKITSRFESAKVLFEGDAKTLKDLLVKASNEDANLRDANLIGANLRGADLRDANLIGADLRGADLRGANLRDADLRGANLRGADLRDANLIGADLRGADLRGANLRDANLIGAKIDGEEITKPPLMIQGLYYWVFITEGFMRIGCKRFTHKEWSEFTDRTIAVMDSQALEFWNEWKEPLMLMCKKHGEVK